MRAGKGDLGNQQDNIQKKMRNIVNLQGKSTHDQMECLNDVFLNIVV